MLAFASLGLAVLAAVVLLAFDALARHAAAVVFLTAFGWLSGLGLAKLYKIVAFMTWLECYGPLLGRKATPRVQDLVGGRAEKWFLLYFVSVWAGSAALLGGQASLFQAAAAAMLIATAGIVVQLLRARRLLDVSSGDRFPEGALRPALFWSLADGGVKRMVRS